MIAWLEHQGVLNCWAKLKICNHSAVCINKRSFDETLKSKSEKIEASLRGMVEAARLRCSRSVRPSGLFNPDIDIPFDFRRHGLQSIKLRCLIGKVSVMAPGWWCLCCYLIMIKYIIIIKIGKRSYCWKRILSIRDCQGWEILLCRNAEVLTRWINTNQKATELPEKVALLLFSLLFWDSPAHELFQLWIHMIFFAWPAGPSLCLVPETNSSIGRYISRFQRFVWKCTIKNKGTVKLRSWLFRKSSKQQSNKRSWTWITTASKRWVTQISGILREAVRGVTRFQQELFMEVIKFQRGHFTKGKWGRCTRLFEQSS